MKIPCIGRHSLTRIDGRAGWLEGAAPLGICDRQFIGQMLRFWQNPIRTEWNKKVFWKKSGPKIPKWSSRNLKTVVRIQGMMAFFHFDSIIFPNLSMRFIMSLLLNRTAYLGKGLLLPSIKRFVRICYAHHKFAYILLHVLSPRVICITGNRGNTYESRVTKNNEGKIGTKVSSTYYMFSRIKRWRIPGVRL